MEDQSFWTQACTPISLELVENGRNGALNRVSPKRKWRSYGLATGFEKWEAQRAFRGRKTAQLSYLQLLCLLKRLEWRTESRFPETKTE